MYPLRHTVSRNKTFLDQTWNFNHSRRNSSNPPIHHHHSIFQKLTTFDLNAEKQISQDQTTTADPWVNPNRHQLNCCWHAHFYSLAQEGRWPHPPALRSDSRHHCILSQPSLLQAPAEQTPWNNFLYCKGLQTWPAPKSRVYCIADVCIALVITGRVALKCNCSPLVNQISTYVDHKL